MTHTHTLTYTVTVMQTSKHCWGESRSESVRMHAQPTRVYFECLQIMVLWPMRSTRSGACPPKRSSGFIENHIGKIFIWSKWPYWIQNELVFRTQTPTRRQLFEQTDLRDLIAQSHSSAHRAHSHKFIWIFGWFGSGASPCRQRTDPFTAVFVLGVV